MTAPRVLVVDDKDNIVKLLARILTPEFDVTTANNGTRALALIAATEFDVVVTDIRMPGADGMVVLQETRRQHPETEVILMTAFGTVQTAVDAMKQGAYDYLQKPFEPDEALLVVRRAAERKHLRGQARTLQSVLASTRQLESLVAESGPMRRVVELIHRAASSDATVLISGESGTGKEVVAQAIHRASPRGHSRFVPVNCGAMPEALVEAELFGYAKGSFTGATRDHAGLFEESAGGTLLLDELADLPLPVQVKLNRALQEHAIRRVGESAERTIDVRVIAATNVDLHAAVAAGTFREDLFYRLNVFPIVIPPLRDRRTDIPLLAALFVRRYSPDGRFDGFTPDALATLIDYDWPGNVRQLENVVQRAIAISDGPKITAAAFLDELPAFSTRLSGLPLEAMTYRDALDVARERATRNYLVALMKGLGGNVTQAAERAGIERESLHRLLKKLGVRSDDFKPKGG
jgi:DNA-binding NtrC family response regulator